MQHHAVVKQAELPNEFAIGRTGENKNKINNSPYPHTKKRNKKSSTKPRNTSNIRLFFTLLFCWLFTLPSGNITQSISFLLDVCRIWNVPLTLKKRQTLIITTEPVCLLESRYFLTYRLKCHLSVKMSILPWRHNLEFVFSKISVR